MITRFEVDGFKSLRQFAIDLEPLTVLVGPNSAGKSNILEALGLLSRLCSMPIDDAFKQGRGKVIDQFTRSGGEAGKAIRFAVEVFLEGVELPAFSEEDPPLPSRYRYELTIERMTKKSGAENLAVADERLCTVGPVDVDVLKQVDATGRERKTIIAAELGDEEPNEYRVPRKHTALSACASDLGVHVMNLELGPATIAALEAIKAARGTKDTSELLYQLALEDAERMGIDPSRLKTTGWTAAIDAVGKHLSHYRILHPDASRLRDSSERLDSSTLAPDASNLPTILADLPEPVLGEIRADLVSLVPGLSNFEIVAEDDSFRIDFELSGGERLPARLVSEGTLRALALLTALRVEPRATILGMEEPENGIYPGRLRTLLALLQESAARTEAEEQPTAPAQIVLTTHSPIVLAAFRHAPERLRFIDLVRREGRLATRARRVGVPSSPAEGAAVVSMREVDELLHAADAEAAE